MTRKGKVLSQIETRGGDYEVVLMPDGTYRIQLYGADKHGVCTAEDVIAWLSNALHNAEYLLIRHNVKGA